LLSIGETWSDRGTGYREAKCKSAQSHLLI